MGAANKCDGTSVVIDATNDVEFGTWDPNTKVFTVLPAASYTSANSIRITARRTGARSNPIALAYGRILGVNNCDVKATVISYVTGGPPAITGLNSFTAHKNLYLASFNSNTVTLPTSASGYHTNNGEVGSNGVLDLGSSGDLWGNEYLGPSRTASGSSVIHGTTKRLSATIPRRPSPAMTPASNPGGVSQTPSINGTVSWPGGTYYFTSLTMGDSDTISFTGPATVYMNGNVSIHDKCLIIPYNYKAANLTWYQASGKNFTVHNQFYFGGQFIAPGADFVANDDLYFGGTMVFKTITLHDKCELYVDENLSGNSSGSGGSGLTTVR